jgi:hypothetical protein
MSHTARPISPTSFATAIHDLPLPTLYAKAAELLNSRAHLLSSNAQLHAPALAGDADCADALRENAEVLARLHDRLLLLRHEVEGVRGARWEGPDLTGVEKWGDDGEGEKEDGDGENGIHL